MSEREPAGYPVREASEPVAQSAGKEPARSEVVREPVAPPADVYREQRTVVRPGIPVIVPSYDPRAERLVWLITAVIDVLLGMRFLFKLLGASSQSAFSSFLFGVTTPLAGPFQGMFGTSSQSGYVFEPACLVGIIVYTLIGWAIAALIRISQSRRGPYA